MFTISSMLPFLCVHWGPGDRSAGGCSFPRATWPWPHRNQCWKLAPEVNKGHRTDPIKRPNPKAFFLKKSLCHHRETPCRQSFILYRRVCAFRPPSVFIHNKINSWSPKRGSGSGSPVCSSQDEAWNGLGGPVRSTRQSSSCSSDSSSDWGALSGKSSPICWNLPDCASHMYLMVTLNSAISYPKSFRTRACSGVSTSPSLHTS